jgi:hypothetical protein
MLIKIKFQEFFMTNKNENFRKFMNHDSCYFYLIPSSGAKKASLLSWTIVLSLFGLLTLNQNCAQSGYQSTTLEEPNTGTPIKGEEPLIAKPSYPRFNLMSANQVYQTFLSLTEQNVDTNTQRTEFNLRRSSFSDQGEVQSVNSPYLLAATSLAGTICNDLVQRERTLSSENRHYFKGINFTQNTASVNDEIFETLVKNLAKKFWKKDLNQKELQALMEYKRTFSEGVTDNTTQTLNLVISTCSALLSNIGVVSL